MNNAATKPLSAKKRALLELVKKRRQEQRHDEIGRRAAGSTPALTPAQRRMWFLASLHPESNAYVIYRVLRLRGPLRPDALRRAFDDIVATHESLRFRVSGADEAPTLDITQARAVPWRTTDLSHLAPGEQDNAVEHRLRAATNRPLNLRRELPIFAELVRLAPTHHILVLGIHHIAADGTSISVLYEQLAAHYTRYVDVDAQPRTPGDETPEPIPVVRFGDYAAWLAQPEIAKRCAAALPYWRTTLHDWRHLELPSDHPRPNTASQHGRRWTFRLSQNASRAVRCLVRGEKTTTFIVILSALKILLSRHSGQTDVVVGTVVSNRNRAQLEQLVGCLINTVPLRTNLLGRPSFRELLGRVRRATIGAYDNQEVPFDLMVRELAPKRDPSRTPLFSVLYAHQTARYDEVPRLQGIEASLLDHDPETSQLDFSIYTWSDEQGIAGHIEYCTDLFQQATIERWIGLLDGLLCQAAEDPTKPVTELDLVRNEEVRRLAGNPGATQATSRFLPELIVDQAHDTPAAAAVIDSHQTLTYLELDRWTNHLANTLLQLGIESGDLVAVMLRRTVQLPVALVAVLKAGGAYVPIDPDYPRARIDAMLAQANPSVVISTAELAGKISGSSDLQVVCIDRPVTVADVEPPRPQLAPESLAYVIFTSGSTGRPKGVAIGHGAMTNFAKAMAERPGIAAWDTVLAITTVSFDIAVLELLVPLSQGATVVVADDMAARDPAAIATLVDKHQVSVVQATPATWRMLLTARWRGHKNLKLLCGGEAMSFGLARALLNCGAELWNMYGPTETTVWSAIARIDPAMVDGRSNATVAIGRPIANTRLFVVDENFKPVPPGVPGELCIAGAGLAQGYWQDPAQTRQRFVVVEQLAGQDPVYRTGDRVMWRTDDRIEFLGRFDHQIKLRGFRIELGEIEASLRGCNGVDEAVVVLDSENFSDTRLVGYVLADAPIENEHLRKHVRAQLPEYMVPSLFVSVAQFPRTPAGKVDRKALRPTDSVRAHAVSGVRSSDSIELQLMAIWREILGVSSVRADDDFFDLGGHSLLALQLTRRVERVFGRSLPLMSVFNAPTPAALAEVLRADGASVPWRALEAIRPRGSLPPLFFVGFSAMARAMARHLPTDQPLWGLNPLGLREDQPDRIDVRSFAAAMVEEISSVQPHGPYRLIGFCNDGKLAFEIALQLAARGHQCEYLGIIDLMLGTHGRTLRQHLTNFVSFGPAYVWHRTVQRAQRTQRRVLDAGLRGWTRLIRRMGGAAPVEMEERLWVLRYYDVLAAHDLGHYPGEVQLYVSQEFEPLYQPVLETLAANGVTRTTVSGFHDTLFERENIAGLSSAVARSLRRASKQAA